MRQRLCAGAVALTMSLAAASVHAAEAAYHHVHLNVPAVDAAVRWYITHMACRAFPGRPHIADCAPALLVFSAGEATGPSVGTGINHIGFSFTDLDARVKVLAGAGVTITTPVREVQGLFKIAVVEDPWGTRIELVEHEGFSGFHHVHLSSVEPEQALTWYQNVFGGERTKMKGMLDAVTFGKVWLLAGRSKEPLAQSQGRVIDHLGFAFPALDPAAAEMKRQGVTFTMAPKVSPPNSLLPKAAIVTGPDGVRIEVGEPPKP